MSYDVVHSIWRTGAYDTYGAVAVRRVDGWKAYLGNAVGYNVKDDEQNIAAMGAPLLEPEARAFFPEMDGIPYAS